MVSNKELIEQITKNMKELYITPLVKEWNTSKGYVIVDDLVCHTLKKLADELEDYEDMSDNVAIGDYIYLSLFGETFPCEDFINKDLTKLSEKEYAEYMYGISAYRLKDIKLLVGWNLDEAISDIHAFDYDLIQIQSTLEILNKK